MSLFGIDMSQQPAAPAPSVRWVNWSPRGRDAYSNPKATVAHATDAQAGDISNGQFPLLCGRWAPDGWDAVISLAGSARRCKRCQKALDKR